MNKHEISQNLRLGQHICLWVGTDWSLSVSKRYLAVSRPQTNAASRSEDVGSNRHRWPRSCSGYHSNPNTPEPTVLLCTDTRSLNSDPQAPPTRDCNMESLQRANTNDITSTVRHKTIKKIISAVTVPTTKLHCLAHTNVALLANSFVNTVMIKTQCNVQGFIKGCALGVYPSIKPVPTAAAHLPSNSQTHMKNITGRVEKYATSLT